MKVIHPNPDKSTFYMQNVEGHFKTITREMEAMQIKLLESPKLSYEVLNNIHRKYGELQNTARFISSLLQLLVQPPPDVNAEPDAAAQADVALDTVIQTVDTSDITQMFPVK